MWNPHLLFERLSRKYQDHGGACRRAVRHQSGTPHRRHRLRYSAAAGLDAGGKNVEQHVLVWGKTKRNSGSLSSNNFHWIEETEEYRCPTGDACAANGEPSRMSFRTSRKPTPSSYDPGNALWPCGCSAALCYGIDSHAVLSRRNMGKREPAWRAARSKGVAGVANASAREGGYARFGRSV